VRTSVHIQNTKEYQFENYFDIDERNIKPSVQSRAARPVNGDIQRIEQ
jgi:hypothetical protein